MALNIEDIMNENIGAAGELDALMGERENEAAGTDDALAQLLDSRFSDEEVEMLSSVAEELGPEFPAWLEEYKMERGGEEEVPEEEYEDDYMDEEYEDDYMDEEYA